MRADREAILNEAVQKSARKLIEETVDPSIKKLDAAVADTIERIASVECKAEIEAAKRWMEQGIFSNVVSAYTTAAAKALEMQDSFALQEALRGVIKGLREGKRKGTMTLGTLCRHELSRVMDASERQMRDLTEVIREELKTTN